jgi:zinc-binding alcohol dehydrogenase family protein
VEPSQAQLVEIARLIDTGHVRPVLDAVLPLARAREAFERGLTGHVRGKYATLPPLARRFSRPRHRLRALRCKVLGRHRQSGRVVRPRTMPVSRP